PHAREHEGERGGRGDEQPRQAETPRSPLSRHRLSPPLLLLISASNQAQASCLGGADGVIPHSKRLVKAQISRSRYRRCAKCRARGHTPAVRRRLIVLLAVVGACLPAASIAGGAATATPRLRLLDSDSVALRGAGFKVHEHVRVSVYAGEHAVKRVTTGRRGGLVVRFTSLHPNACAGFPAMAAGHD